MSLSSGTRLGTYTITSLIGAGGMGEVYQARDSKLERDVALKVLPEQFARDQERLARFQREAKLLASLNHPNIATIHGLEQSGDTHYLVMELVAGKTLRDRLLRDGRVPVEEALAIARQIAEALEAAHESEKGIIHRDLKPANVKVTPDGKVKVLDFGLAKAFATDAASQDFSNSPTLSMAPTMQGVIMGTASYMSPEQARGLPVTKATDIFAFGAVLYELLTGKQAFQGEDVGEILATVVKSEPDWSRLPGDTPPSVRTLLKRCLRKERRQRLGDAGAVRIEIEDAIAWMAEGGAKETATPPIGRLAVPGRAAWIVAAIAVVIAAAGWGAFAYFRPRPQSAEAIQFLVSPPEGWDLLQTAGSGGASPSPLAISPDGQRLAFAATGPDGRSFLWVRPLDTLAAQMLSGTEGAAQPFWSPDGQFLAFFAEEKLKKIAASGGPVITLCDSSAGLSGAWNRDGVILLGSNQGSSPIFRVSATGGTPVTATTVIEDDLSHARPTFLPDGRHFLYRTGTGLSLSIYVASLDSSERKLLLKVNATPVVYSAGHLLFLRERTLMAQAFDSDRLELTGEAFPIAEEIQTYGTSPNAVFSASENGVLVYQTGGTTHSSLLWFDRSRKQVGVLGEPGAFYGLELSPDGRRAAVSVNERNNRDIWIYDLARGIRSRLTFDPAMEMDAIWSPDGSRLIFNSNRKGRLNLYQKAADGSGEEALLFEDENGKVPLSWSADGPSLLYGTGLATAQTGTDLLVLPFAGERRPIPLVQSPFNESQGRLSPDGKWVAYRSDESGRYEIYVASYPALSAKRQISTGGGNWPRWRQDGREIFYFEIDGTLMAAAVNGSGAAVEVGAVKTLFETRVVVTPYPYDVTADGQRFLINTRPGDGATEPITVVVNWLAGVEK